MTSRAFWFLRGFIAIRVALTCAILLAVRVAVRVRRTADPPLDRTPRLFAPLLGHYESLCECAHEPTDLLRCSQAIQFFVEAPRNLPCIFVVHLECFEFETQRLAQVLHWAHQILAIMHWHLATIVRVVLSVQNGQGMLKWQIGWLHCCDPLGLGEGFKFFIRGK